MTHEHLHWVIGSGGLLGSSLNRALSGQRRFAAQRVDWESPYAPNSLATDARKFVDAAGEGGWTVYWCAGSGVIGSGAASLEQETKLLHGILEVLRASVPGTVFLSSSAGGVYGGTSSVPINEASTENPLSDYGRNKLIQESGLIDWAAETRSRAVIGRMSNLYGPGQDLSKPQGLISQLCLSALLRRPISIYVSLDTLRDYLYVDDCSQAILQLTDAARVRLAPGANIKKVIASGMSVSIGALFSEIRRVVGRQAAYVLASSPATRQQSPALVFRSSAWPDLDRRPRTPLPVGIHRTTESLRRALRSGALSR